MKCKWVTDLVELTDGGEREVGRLSTSSKYLEMAVLRKVLAADSKSERADNSLGRQAGGLLDAIKNGMEPFMVTEVLKRG